MGRLTVHDDYWIETYNNFIAWGRDKKRRTHRPPSLGQRLRQWIRNILMDTKGELREAKREKKRKGMKVDGRSIKTLMANREAVVRMNK